MAEATTSTTAVVTTATPSWLKQHETLIIVFLVLASLVFIGNKYINHADSAAAQKATVAQQQLSDQKDKDNALAQQVAQSYTQYKEMFAQLSQQNAQLSASIAQRNTGLATQQATDQTSTDAQLLARLKQLDPNLVSTVTTDANGVQVTQQGARDAVSDLEQVPVLQKDLQDAQTQNENEQQELNKSTALVSQLQTQVTGLDAQITDETNTCKAEVASANASAKKSKLNWFKGGLVIGFVSGLFVGHGL